MSSLHQHQRGPTCPHCRGPKYMIDGSGAAVECGCSTAEPCGLCRGRGFREIAGAPIRCVCSGGPGLQAREFPAHTRARADGRETSQEAAKAVTMTPTLNANQWQVYNAFRATGPAIHQQVVRVTRDRGHKQSSSGIRTRTAELVEIGLVRDTGRTAKTEAGFNATVWEAVSMTAFEVGTR